VRDFWEVERLSRRRKQTNIFTSYSGQTGGVDPPPLGGGHLGGGEPIVKPACGRSVLCFEGGRFSKANVTETSKLL